MKILALALLLTGFFSIFSYAQSPQVFNYQAVARDAAGAVLADQNVSFRISILEGNAGGTAVYTETHLATTNQFGLVNLKVGNGTYVSGDFATIDWAGDAFFLKVEMDESGDVNYQLMGTAQLLSVPYSLHSETTGDTSRWRKSSNGLYYLNGNIGIGTDSPDDSSILDIESDEKGLLIPRMSESERDAINDPAQGLQIFNLTTGCLNYYFGTSWCSLCGCDGPPEAWLYGPMYECSGSTSVLLEANDPVNGNGWWEVVSSTGSCSFSDQQSPTTYFYGSYGCHYNLKWQTFNSCGTAWVSKYISFTAPGIFVDAIYGDDSNDGSFYLPVKTITKGIILAMNLYYQNVFVAEGVYEEQVVLADGIDLYGGFDHFSNYSNPVLFESRIEYQGKAVVAMSLTDTQISGFTIVGKSGGENVYGLYIQDCQGFGVYACEVISESAGYGPDGYDGIDGTIGVKGMDGEDGCENGGTATCGNCVEPIAGTGGMANYGGAIVNGGNGGSPGFAQEYDGSDGTDGQGLYSASGGLGGAYLEVGTNGENGILGESGVNGTGGLPFGSTASSGYQISSGSIGGDGQHGSGGGGGGGQGGVILYYNYPSEYCYKYGGAGGGGGSGGEAGTGAGGGEGGYGSFGIWIYSSYPIHLHNITIKTGNGGHGGRGGMGGKGGAGGIGGEGGESPPSNLVYAGNGGDGSNGTDGGYGGGGGGGPSIGIVKDPSSPDVIISNITYEIGAGGLGGFSYGYTGQVGQSAETNF